MTRTCLTQSVCCQVLELCMLLSDGELMTLRRHDDDADVFDAACLSLGALGVIVSLKLQCEPAFNLQQVQYSVPLKDVRTSVIDCIYTYKLRQGDNVLPGVCSLVCMLAASSKNCW